MSGVCLEERSVGIEVKKPTIKSIPYEDFKKNEYLENMVKQLNESGTKAVSYTHLFDPNVGFLLPF